MLPEDIDKSEGGHPWNLTRPSAYLGAYFAQFIVPEAIKLIFPQFAEDYADIMDEHAKNRGLVRKAATAATGEITITGTEGTKIPTGSAFSTASVNGEPAIEFKTTKEATINGDGIAKISIEAVDAGSVGNVPVGTIILKANQISGISAVTNEHETSGGTEEETTESLQQRIMEYDATKGVSFVGSPPDYKRWALEVNGTGNAIIIEPTDDSGLIKIVLTDANGAPANEELRQAVYNHIMRPDAPEERLAPLNGGNIEVVAPESVEITISVVVETDGTPISAIKEDLVDRLTVYALEALEDREIRYSKVYSIISNTEGVEDLKAFLLNGMTGNITITDSQIPTVSEDSINITEGIV
ncbi:MAG: baseplate J/gp47 family protein [Bacteroidaceae bacterium]|nr:baseplate J/gp47 family protein [Bacteroidaceae bacterium]